MKRLCLLLLLIPIALLCYAPNGLEPFIVWESKPISIVPQRKETLLRITYLAERPKSKKAALQAYYKENAVGILQIRPITVRACNEIVGYQKYFLADRRDSLKSIEMFFTFMDKHNPKYDLEKGAYLWNGGEGYEKQPLKYRLDVVRYWMAVRKHV